MKDHIRRVRLPLFLACLGGLVCILHMALRVPWDRIVVISIISIWAAWLGRRIGPVVRPDIYNPDGTQRAKDS